jgi:hypothetical protein
MHILTNLKVFVFNKLYFLKVSEPALSQQAVNEFEELYEQFISKGNGDFIPYKSNFPKYAFFNYLIEKKNVLVHGSNLSDITRFEPREQTLFNGKPVKAVFAASDGIWSLFFAVINRKDYLGSLRNICLTILTKKGIKRFYYFSVNKDFQGKCWTNGTIYILPKNMFKNGGIKDEWVCESEVKPLAKMSVTPDDFPFTEQVKKHHEGDSALKSIVKALVFKKSPKR